MIKQLNEAELGAVNGGVILPVPIGPILVAVRIAASLTAGETAPSSDEE